MTITELLGQLARAKDRLAMGQKNTNIVFQYLVGRSEWGYETANGLCQAQHRLPEKDTLDYAIGSLEEALDDLKTVRQEVQERRGGPPQ